MRMFTIVLMMGVLASCGGAASVPAGNPTSVPATDATTAPASAVTVAPAPTPVPTEAAPDMIGPAAQVMASLVQQLGLDGANLQYVGAEEQQWPTPALGCPQKGMMYTQVITPGYKITFTDGTTTYDVHTNQTGDQAVLCQNGTPTELTTVGS